LKLSNTNITLRNESIEVVEINHKSLFNTFLNMIYFSTVTITNGNGNMFPLSSFTRIITSIEMLIGQFLLIIAIGKAFNTIKG